MSIRSLRPAIVGLLLLAAPAARAEPKSIQETVTADVEAIRGDKVESSVEVVTMFRDGLQYYTLKPEDYRLLTKDPAIEGAEGLNAQVVSADVSEVPVTFFGGVFKQYEAKGYAIALKVRFRPGRTAPVGTQKVTVRLPGVKRVGQDLGAKDSFDLFTPEARAEFTVKVYESREAYDAEKQALHEAERKRQEEEEAKRQAAYEEEQRQRREEAAKRQAAYAEEQRQRDQAAAQRAAALAVQRQREEAAAATLRLGYWERMGAFGGVFVLDLVVVLMLLHRYNRLTKEHGPVALAPDDRLPDLCAWCGQKATARATRAFSASVLPWLEGAANKKTIAVPLCASHADHFRQGRLGGYALVGFLAGGAAALGLGLWAGWEEIAVALCAQSVFLGLCAFTFWGRLGLHAQRVDGPRVLIAPVANSFAQAFAAAKA
jgi:hypothetical protein